MCYFILFTSLSASLPWSCFQLLSSLPWTFHRCGRYDCLIALPRCQLPAASYSMQRLQPLLRIRHRYRPAASRHGLIHFNGANQWSAVGDECRHLLNSRSKCAITYMASTGDRISDQESVQNADRYIMYICRFPQADTFVKIPYNVCYVAVATNWYVLPFL